MQLVILYRDDSMSVTRIAISLEPELLEKIEARLSNGSSRNRSKAISDILRDWFLKEEMITGHGTRVGAISIVYNHHTKGVLDRITEIQHQYGANVISTMHVHLTHDDCLEVITTKGDVSKIQKIAQAIGSVRGVSCCKLSVVG